MMPADMRNACPSAGYGVRIAPMPVIHQMASGVRRRRLLVGQLSIKAVVDWKRGRLVIVQDKEQTSRTKKGKEGISMCSSRVILGIGKGQFAMYLMVYVAFKYHRRLAVTSGTSWPPLNTGCWD